MTKKKTDGKKQIEKQEKTDLDLDFSNLSKANQFFTEEKVIKNTNKTEKKESTTSYFKLIITTDCKKAFLRLFTDYREYNDEYDADTSKFFNEACDFLISKYKGLGVYKKAPKSFSSHIFRKGKRQTTDRTPVEGNKVELRLVGDLNTLEKYADLCYYFCAKFHNKDYTDMVYSKVFFFYDFIEELKTYQKDFIKFN